MDHASSLAKKNKGGQDRNEFQHRPQPAEGRETFGDLCRSRRAWRSARSQKPKKVKYVENSAKIKRARGTGLGKKAKENRGGKQPPQLLLRIKEKCMELKRRSKKARGKKELRYIR